MAFLTLAISGAVAAGTISAFAGAVLTTLAGIGTSLGISALSSKYLGRKKKRSYSAVSGEIHVGGGVPVFVGFGATATKGYRPYYAKFGAGDKYNVDVYVLSSFWCEGLESYVWINSEKKNLLPLANIGGEHEHYDIEGYEGLFSIRFYDGRPGQIADAKLVADTASLGNKWEAGSTGTNQCYVVVERLYDEKFNGRDPDILWLTGSIRCYDLRKDSTFPGGSGNHRIDDPSTWEGTKNPAIQRLNYQLGFRGPISGVALIGQGKDLSHLDTASYIASANVSDTQRIVDGESIDTYQCNIIVHADDDHTEVLKEFDDAMAGYTLNRSGLAGVLAGAPQIPVITITEEDIRTDAPIPISYRRSAFDQVNHLSGQFISPDSMFQPEDLDLITSASDVANDGRLRSKTNDVLQITDPRIGQYVLTIRYRQSRHGGRTTIPVSTRMFLSVESGNAVNYIGKEWLVHDKDEGNLTLAETSSTIFAEGGITPGPIIIPPSVPINPSLLTTVQNFNAQAGYLGSADLSKRPVLEFTWDKPEDPSITSVIIEYQREGGSTVSKAVSSTPETGELTLTANVMSGSIYKCRATIQTLPDRRKTWTAYINTTLPTRDATVHLRQMQADVTQMLVNVRRDADDARDLFNMDMPTVSSIDMARSFIARREVKREGKGTLARLIEQEDVQANDQEAVASQLISLETVTGNNTSGLAQEITARTTQFDANTLAIQTAQSQANGNTAGIAAEAVTRADADATNTLAIQTAQSQANGNTAGIAAEAVTRADADATNTLAIQTAQSQANGNTAGIAAEEITRTTQFDAIASSAATAQATANEGTATGHSKLEVSAGPAGWDAQIQWYLRAANDVGENYVEAALWMRAMLNANGGDSQIGLKAGQIVLVNSLGVILLLAGDDGIIIPGRIPEITVGMIKALTITADRFVLNGATGEGTASVLTGSYVRSITGTDWEDLDSMSVTMDVADYAKVMLIAKVNSIDEYSQNYSIELRITDNGTAVTTETALHAGKGEIHLTVFTQPIEIGASHTYKIQWKKTVWSADTTQVLHRSLKAMQFKM